MWGSEQSGPGHFPLFIPNPLLSLVPVTLAAGKVLAITKTEITNDGTPIAGAPTLQQFQAIEWTCGTGACQVYFDSDTTKLGPPMEALVDGIKRGLTAYNIKNTTASSLTLYVRGM